MMPTFDQVFQTATGNTPYGYQRRLAELPCESRLIDAPTGLGKTAAVVMAWLWNRVALQNPDWPRRLVYTLPMRTLVEQTRDEAENWVEALAAAGFITEKPRIVVLMGGETLDDHEREWDIHPEADTILIGTQDMLISRALNRGYGMTRARWPMHFGLLNNDCLWILDETQLMGVGVRTSAQLEGLRQRLGTASRSHTWWSSATLDTRLLETPDHSETPPSLTLNEQDKQAPEVLARIQSVKRLHASNINLAADNNDSKSAYYQSLATEVAGKHQSGTLTLVIVNRIERAVGLYTALEKLPAQEELPARLLIHSRYRPMERQDLSDRLKESGEKIIISTQAIEAGVDISARVLFTELAPWSSLVQRFGRCNRKGEFNGNGGAEIHWIDLAPKDEKAAAALALPYTMEQLDTARRLISTAAENGDGASPDALSSLDACEPLPESHLLRCKDLVDLFDTTPDLAGRDIDVARYIRDDEERDVQVFWRDLKELPDEDLQRIRAQREELVRVPTHRFKKFAEKHKGKIWLWDTLEGQWEGFRNTYRVAPGRIFLADLACGGYSELLGWTGESSKTSFTVLDPSAEEKVEPSEAPRDGQDRNDDSFTHFQSIAEHTGHVISAVGELMTALPASVVDPWRDAVLTAALWHDVGKAHASFQDYLTKGRAVPTDYQVQLLAKSSYLKGIRPSRKHFRHELASTLAWLQAGKTDDPQVQNLVAWLIATHHGKIRLSIRSLPGETLPRDAEDRECPDTLHARGIWDGDTLTNEDGKSLQLDGIPESLPPLDLSLMQMGGSPDAPSWTTRALALRDSEDLGIFRLAWLEALFRAADALGSQKS